MTDKEILELHRKHSRKEITFREFTDTLYGNDVAPSRYAKILIIDLAIFTLKCAAITAIFIYILWSISS
jgi:hypothetical protein